MEIVELLCMHEGNLGKYRVLGLENEFGNNPSFILVIDTAVRLEAWLALAPPPGSMQGSGGRRLPRVGRAVRVFILSHQKSDGNEDTAHPDMRRRLL
jgi:hypothetical protein